MRVISPAPLFCAAASAHRGIAANLEQLNFRWGQEPQGDFRRLYFLQLSSWRLLPAINVLPLLCWTPYFPHTESVTPWPSKRWCWCLCLFCCWMLSWRPDFSCVFHWYSNSGPGIWMCCWDYGKFGILLIPCYLSGSYHRPHPYGNQLTVIPGYFSMETFVISPHFIDFIHFYFSIFTFHSLCISADWWGGYFSHRNKIISCF